MRGRTARSSSACAQGPRQRRRRSLAQIRPRARPAASPAALGTSPAAAVANAPSRTGPTAPSARAASRARRRRARPATRIARARQTSSRGRQDDAPVAAVEQGGGRRRPQAQRPAARRPTVSSPARGPQPRTSPPARPRAAPAAGGKNGLICVITHGRCAELALHAWAPTAYREVMTTSRIALVTGANQGLGHALVEGLAARMAPADRVLFTGRDPGRVRPPRPASPPAGRSPRRGPRARRPRW